MLISRLTQGQNIFLGESADFGRKDRQFIQGPGNALLFDFYPRGMYLLQVPLDQLGLAVVLRSAIWNHAAEIPTVMLETT